MRFVFVYLIFALLVSCSPSSSQENQNPEDHIHSWKEVSVNDTATCLEDGVITHAYVCTVCNETKTEEEPSKAKGHQWGEFVEVIKPTCSAEGKREKKCSVCNATEQEIISKLEHSFTSSTVAATCQSFSVTTYTCRNCGYSYKEQGSVYGEHKYARTAYKAPSCTVGGAARYECSVCGDSYEENLPALGGRDYNFLYESPSSLYNSSTAFADCSVCGDRYQEGLDISSYNLTYMCFYRFVSSYDKATGKAFTETHIISSSLSTEATFSYADGRTEKHKVYLDQYIGSLLSFKGEELVTAFENSSEICQCTIAGNTLSNALWKGNLRSDGNRQNYISTNWFDIGTENFMKYDSLVVQISIGDDLTIDATFDMSSIWQLLRDANAMIESLH